MKKVKLILLLIFVAIAVVGVAVLGYYIYKGLQNDGSEYTITFDTQGGSEIAPITIRSGESLTLPEAPTKEGYVFGGWYLNSDCIEKYDDSYVISKDLTLYAKWWDPSTDSRQLEAPSISINGTILSWSVVQDAEKYELKLYSGNELIDTYYTTQLSFDIDNIGIKEGTYTLKARTIGDGVIFLDSVETIKQISYKMLLPVANAIIDDESSVLTWTKVDNAETYTVYVDSVEIGNTSSNSLDLSVLNAGQYVIKIVAERSGFVSSNATFTLLKSRLSTPNIEAEIQPENNFSNKISWSAIDKANQYVIIVDKKEVATTLDTYYVLSDSDWGSNIKANVSVYAKDVHGDYLMSVPSEILTITRIAKIVVSHNITDVSLVKVEGKSYSPAGNFEDDYSSATDFYVGVDCGESKKLVAIPQEGYVWLGWYDKNGKLLSTETEYVLSVDTTLCEIVAHWESEPEPMPEVKLEMLSGGYMIGRKWYQLPYVDNAFAYKFTFGNGDEDGIILNRSTLSFYDIPIDAKYIEYKALGGVLDGVRYLDSDSRRVDLAFWHYPVKYNSETYSVKNLLKEKFKLSKITSFKFGKLEEEHGESALSGTSFWRGRGGYLLVEGSDSNGVPKKLYQGISDKNYASLGELFDKIPELVYYDELSVEEVNDTNRFELEDFKYYMQNEIIPHMQEHFPKYAAFFNTCDMADYEISNYVGFGVYNSRYDHEDQVVSVDLKNAQGRTLHLELEMDMRFGSVENWKYAREHNMLFSQLETVSPYMKINLHSYWIFPTTYFDNDGDKAIKPNEEFNQKIIDTEIYWISYIFPSLNYYLNGEERDALWIAHLSDITIYPMPNAEKGERATYTFVTNCEQTVEPIAGSPVTLPTLTREGYHFCGWYDNAAFEGSAFYDSYFDNEKTTLYAKWLTDEEWNAMSNGTSFEKAYIANSGTTYYVDLTTAGQIVYFAFTPTVDGSFTIQSTGSCDTYGTLYDSTQSALIGNEDGGGGMNFKITYNMTAGTTYYIAVTCYSTGTFKVSFS